MTFPARPTPFDLIFGTIAPDRFLALGDGIAASGRDPRARDAFLLVREVVELLRELRPEEGLGEGMGAMAAFLHQAYLYWLDGRRTVSLDDDRLGRVLSASAVAGTPAAGRTSGYVQLPSLRVWAVPVEGGSAEPLDGWFATPTGDELDVLAIFGLYPGRPGFSAVEVRGARPEQLVRADGSQLFAPALPGGAAAGLASVVGAEELLELAWRVSA
jgi:hypothetical protein